MLIRDPAQFTDEHLLEGEVLRNRLDDQLRLPQSIHLHRRLDTRHNLSGLGLCNIVTFNGSIEADAYLGDGIS